MGLMDQQNALKIQRFKRKSFINLGSYSTQKEFWQLRHWILFGITLLKEKSGSKF